LATKSPVPMSDSNSLIQALRPAIRDQRVLSAIAELARERFVPKSQHGLAYENVALPIACSQTISQPLVVARMLELLELSPSDRVLDVGTGSGYHAALLARLARHVWTIERHADLSAQAQQTLARAGIDNVTFLVGDGSRGLPEKAPFDAINVAAAAGEAAPAALEEQLATAGRLVVPVGLEAQRLMLVRRTADGLRRAMLDPVRFVPLVRDRRVGPR
jgi:protein-L-isoaspartate(D-aspartate) O-methyltransferase